MSRSAIPRLLTAFSIGWCITPTASKCEANRCVKSVAARSSNFRRRRSVRRRRILRSRPLTRSRDGPRVASLRERRKEKRRGKRGKLKKRVSHSFHRAWKSGQPRRIPTFAPRRRRGSYPEERTKKDEDKTKLQLTHPGHFMHHNCASVASLRP